MRKSTLLSPLAAVSLVALGIAGGDPAGAQTDPGPDPNESGVTETADLPEAPEPPEQPEEQADPEDTDTADPNDVEDPTDVEVPDDTEPEQPDAAEATDQSEEPEEADVSDEAPDTEDDEGSGSDEAIVPLPASGPGELDTTSGSTPSVGSQHSVTPERTARHATPEKSQFDNRHMGARRVGPAPQGGADTGGGGLAGDDGRATTPLASAGAAGLALLATGVVGRRRTAMETVASTDED